MDIAEQEMIIGDCLDYDAPEIEELLDNPCPATSEGF
jgi:hypothetical protein